MFGAKRNTYLVKKQQDPHLSQTDFNFHVHPSLRNNSSVRAGFELKSHQLFISTTFDGLYFGAVNKQLPLSIQLGHTIRRHAVI